MRLIGTLSHSVQASTFASLLAKQSIAYVIETKTIDQWDDPAYGQTLYEFWIVDEDKIEQAQECLQLSKQNSQQTNSSPPQENSSTTNFPLDSTPSTTSNSSLGLVTSCLLFICIAFFVYASFPSFSSTKETPKTYFLPPLQQLFLYDYPYYYAQVEQFMRKYGYEAEKEQKLSLVAKKEWQKINQIPHWQGIYPLLTRSDKNSIKDSIQNTPLFEKIKQKQWWRFFTPSLLHSDILHLLFNMLWLIVLGKEIEKHLSLSRYLLLLLFLAAISNTAQYLMSGPNFIGFSGVLCGLLAFIWMRQHIAPWEGYTMDRLSIFFMLIFVLGMAGLQILSFAVQKAFALPLSLNLANTAHIVGGLSGLMMGRWNFFRWRVS